MAFMIEALCMTLYWIPSSTARMIKSVWVVALQKCIAHIDVST